MEKKKLTAPLALILAVLSVASCLYMLSVLATSSGTQHSTGNGEEAGVNMLDRFDTYMTNKISAALDGVMSIEKSYWLSDSDLIAPKPNPDGYGTADSPAQLQWLMQLAVSQFGGKELLLKADTEVWEEYPIHYYYDETILVVAWKQVIDHAVYTFSEVKIAHPSQLRRFLAGGTYGSDKQYTTTDMAASVNAVLASSGDFYKFRHNGAVVYQGQLQRFEGYHVDTCFINDQGDLLFKYRQELSSQKEAQQFVDDNNIRFSLAFGPVMIDNGENKVPTTYALGEIKNRYSRTALCQMGQLHYLLVNCGGDGGANDNRHKMSLFADYLIEMGVPKAYSLDGGQTAVLAMDGELVNRPDYGTQRKISDIIYFATALPEGG